MTRDFLPDHAYNGAPRWPVGRPPTRAEVWARMSHLYRDIKQHDELVAFCREQWIGEYVAWFNFKGWRKQPDWTEDQPIIPEAIPTKLFYHDEKSQWYSTLRACLERTIR